MSPEVLTIEDACKLKGLSERSFLCFLEEERIRPVVFFKNKKQYLYISQEMVNYFYFSSKVHNEAVASLFEKDDDSYREVVSAQELFLIKKESLRFFVNDLNQESAELDARDTKKDFNKSAIKLNTETFEDCTLPNGKIISLDTGKLPSIIKYLYTKKKINRHLISRGEIIRELNLDESNRFEKALASKGLIGTLVSKPQKGFYQLNVDV